MTFEEWWSDYGQYLYDDHRKDNMSTQKFWALHGWNMAVSEMKRQAQPEDSIEAVEKPETPNKNEGCDLCRGYSGGGIFLYCPKCGRRLRP